MLYITRLELRNIRRFPQLLIQFREARSCSLFVGDNGDGKSTVLRSLAMGLCDQGSAAALLRELPGEFVRHGSDGESFVQVDLAGAGGWRYRIHTRFIGLGRFERVEQTYFESKGKRKFRKINEDAFPWS